MTHEANIPTTFNFIRTNQNKLFFFFNGSIELKLHELLVLVLAFTMNNLIFLVM